MFLPELLFCRQQFVCPPGNQVWCENRAFLLASYNQEPAVAGFLSCCFLCRKQDPPTWGGLGWGEGEDGPGRVLFADTEEPEESCEGGLAVSDAADRPCLRWLLLGSRETSLHKNACTSYTLGSVSFLPLPFGTPEDSSLETDLLPPL